MHGYLTKTFLKEFPEHIQNIILPGNNYFSDFYRAVQQGWFISGIDERELLSIFEELKKSEVQEQDLALEILVGLFSSGKLKGIKIDDSTQFEIPELIIRKSVLKLISKALAQQTDTVLHTGFENNEWKNQLTEAGKKPIFDMEDLSSGKANYLFKEESLPLNIGENFNWSHFLYDYILPFKKIRILDPYLYVNIRDVNLAGLLHTLIGKSGDKIRIEIISNLSANNKWTEKELIDRLKKELTELNKPAEIILYTQKGSAGSVFHKRAIWTDFWALHTDRGLDFAKHEPGKGKVKQENTIYIAGKYASKNSIWHQIHNNWADYVNAASKIE